MMKLMLILLAILLVPAMPLHANEPSAGDMVPLMETLEYDMMNIKKAADAKDKTSYDGAVLKFQKDLADTRKATIDGIAVDQNGKLDPEVAKDVNSYFDKFDEQAKAMGADMTKAAACLAAIDKVEGDAHGKFGGG